LADGGRELLSAREPEALHDLLTRARAGRAVPSLPFGHTPAGEEEAALAEGHLWYAEPRRSGPLWRGGRARLTAGRLVWKSPVDSRPALVLRTADLTEVPRLPGPGGWTPPGRWRQPDERRTRPDERRTRPDERRTRPDERRTRPDGHEGRRPEARAGQGRTDMPLTVDENSLKQGVLSLVVT